MCPMRFLKSSIHFESDRCGQLDSDYACSVTLEPSASATILVVDDESALLRLLSRVLEKAGHTVVTAMDGEQAVSVFDKHVDLLDAVILDVNLPPKGIHGVVAHMLQRRGDLQLILSSGDNLDPKLSEIVSAQGGTFLRKPFVPKTLLNVVSSNLEASGRLARELEGREER
jgi:two-component system cell cycle sensor histidine kinase/response regulator CckA